jgi:ATP-dependent protease HslVU (ClpYQ) peptidase subunit
MVCDRCLSLCGGYFSQDGAAVKFRPIHPEWHVMFAGDASEAQPLLDAVEVALQKLKPNMRGEVVKRCRDAYMTERRRMIETQIFPDYDIDNWNEFRALRTKDERYYERIQQVIVEREQGWSLLFAGFDKNYDPHLFTITERGNVTYYNAQGFAAIGSGSLAALMWLATSGYRKNGPIGEKILNVITAKFFSETAPDVGQETIAVVTRPHSKMGALLGDDQQAVIRAAWEQLPRIPVNMVDSPGLDFQQRVHNLTQYAKEFKFIKSRGITRVVRKNKSTPLTSEKSEQVP